MGRLYSKLHASSLVSLCKQRKDIIKAAKYCRYDLVTSFDLYLDSLFQLGNALNQYVELEFLIFDYSCIKLELSSSDIGFDLHHLHCDDLEFSSSDIDFDLHHLHCDDDDEEEEEELISSIDFSSEVMNESIYTCKLHASDRNNMRNKGKSTFEFENTTSQKPYNFYSNINPKHRSYDENIHLHMSHEDFGHSKHSQRNEIPQRVNNRYDYEHYGNNPFHMDMSHEDFGHHDHSQRKETSQIRVHRYEHYGSKPYPMIVSPNPVLESHNHETSHQNNAPPPLPPPPPPPPPQSNSWDFLYPFSMKYEVPYDHDEDERKIREREGIPDLEDKTELSSTASTFYNHNGTENGNRHHCSSNGTFSVGGINCNQDSFSTTEESFKGNLEPKATIQDIESLRTSGVCITTPDSSSRMSLKEAVLEINNDFKHICDCGRELSSVVEAGKLPYYSQSTKLRAFACCVLAQIFPFIPSFLYPSYMSYQQTPRTKMLLSNDKMQNSQELTKSGDLSSTLEQLHLWEKKLYSEVLTEEKHRILYDKQCKRLKELDGKGSESNKVDDTLASIKLLQSEISVVIASISVISREIHELTDDKLLPELYKLIDGLLGLWKIMSTCHQKQFQAISKAISHVHIVDPLKKNKSSSKATLKLKKVVLNWGKCFSNFIKKQKTLVKHLNDWLQRCSLKETEENEDRISTLLPSDLEAPPIFKVCNNWYNAINKVSEIEVSKAINNFASNLHQFYQKLKEEHALKVRVKHFFKDYKQRFRSYCKKNYINSQQYYSFIKMKATDDFEENEIPLLRVSNDNLAVSRLRLIEERKKHQQFVKHVNDAASSCLQEGLTPIFEALLSFSLENLNIYEQLKFPNGGPHEQVILC